MPHDGGAHGAPARERRGAGVLRYAIVTFGCRVNQADSLRIERTCALAAASRPPPLQPILSS